jgi:membrane complex biogenesis BtpA family protein
MSSKPRFTPKKSVIAMIHVDALPGTPQYGGHVREIIAKAAKEATLYKKGGVDAIAIENMHDIPYLKGRVGPEIVATMTAVAAAIKEVCALPCGIQILAGANKEALAVAHATGLDFVRVEGFVFAHVADEGFIESSAGDLLRYRRQIGADSIAVFCDIKKKHSAHAITADVDIAETAKAAEFFLTDGVIVTGSATGAEADERELREVRRHVNVPVIVGSGVTIDNVQRYAKLVDGMIVGSWFKKDGRWENGVDLKRVDAFMKKIK